MPDSIRNHVAIPETTGTSTPVLRRQTPDVLDWDAFSASRFHERRRHNLEGVIAYGIYRRSYAMTHDGSDAAAVVVRPRDLPAIQGWEDEGGA